MAAPVRITVGRRSREPGTQVGVQVNAFGLSKLQGITGDDLAELLLKAGEPAYEQAYENWAVLTGASRDSIELMVAETGTKHARVVLQAGGEKLMSDSRNKSGKDYAPFLEFNGSPSGSAAPGVLRNAIYDNDTAIRELVRAGLVELIKERIA